MSEQMQISNDIGKSLLEAQSYEEAGKLSSALRMYYRVLKLEKSSFGAHLGIGRCALLLGEAHKAYEHFSFVLIGQNQNAEAYWGRGSALIALGEEKRGLKDILKAVSLDYPASELRIDCAAQLNSLGRCGEALAALDEVPENEQSFDYILERSFAQLALGQSCDVDLESLYRSGEDDSLFLMVWAACKAQRENDFSLLFDAVRQVLQEEPDLESRAQTLLIRLGVQDSESGI